MAFSYDPKDADTKLLEEGSYDAQVMTVEEKTSKAGNHMLQFTIKVWSNGGIFHLPDYVVNPKSLWKLKQLSEALGFADKFASGKLDPHELVGKNFTAFVKTRKDEKGKYGDQNVITRYSSSAPSTSIAPASREPGIDDDDIRF